MGALRVFSVDDGAQPHVNVQLSDFFETTYLKWHPKLRPGSQKDYRLQIRNFSTWLNRPAELDDLNDDTVVSFLSDFSEERSAGTTDKARRTLLLLWTFAVKKKLITDKPHDVPVFESPDRCPEAWTVDEMQRLLKSARVALPLRQSRKRTIQWTARCWTALILTVYDTSLRIHSVLQCKRCDINLETGMLRTHGEHQKHGNDERQRLHPETVAAIKAMIEEIGPTERLFPWPFKERLIWKHFKKILTNAKLSATSRDLFHKIRRTSYTMVHALLGPEAATQHAGHASNLSKYYLDTEVARQVAVDKKDAVDVLPRF